MPFCNNLKKDDPVFDVETKRPGKIANNPRETSRFVSVLLQGTTTPRSIDVMRLRLVVDGKPEDVPPIEGEPPAIHPHDDRPAPSTGLGVPTALSAIREDRAKIKERMAIIEAEFRTLRATDDRLATAEKALT